MKEVVIWMQGIPETVMWSGTPESFEELVKSLDDWLRRIDRCVMTINSLDMRLVNTYCIGFQVRERK